MKMLWASAVIPGGPAPRALASLISATRKSARQNPMGWGGETAKPRAWCLKPLRKAHEKPHSKDSEYARDPPRGGPSENPADVIRAHYYGDQE